MTGPCSHEATVLTAMRAGQPAPLNDEVLAHLAECESCREALVLATALRDDRADLVAQARVPSAGQAWWRAELRARHEAAEAAARPITVVSGLAAASLIGVLASMAGLLAVLMPSWAMLPAEWALPTGLRLALWLVAGAMLAAVPVLLYVTLRDE